MKIEFMKVKGDILMKIDAVGLTTDGKKWFPVIFKNAPTMNIIYTPKQLKCVGRHEEGYFIRSKAEASIAKDNLLKNIPLIKGDVPWNDNSLEISIFVDKDFCLILDN